MNVQFKKGVLEMLVLSVVAQGDCYGYELVSRISSCIDIAEGTIYPLLKRLHNEGCFETYLKESAEGPPRKYYRLTAHGHAAVAAMQAEWAEFVGGVGKLLAMNAKSTAEGPGHHEAGRVSPRAGATAGEAP